MGKEGISSRCLLVLFHPRPPGLCALVSRSRRKSLRCLGEHPRGVEPPLLLDTLGQPLRVPLPRRRMKAAPRLPGEPSRPSAVAKGAVAWQGARLSRRGADGGTEAVALRCGAAPWEIVS